jgi:hypothetical protein
LLIERRWVGKMRRYYSFCGVSDIRTAGQSRLPLNLELVDETEQSVLEFQVSGFF